MVWCGFGDGLVWVGLKESSMGIDNRISLKIARQEQTCHCLYLDSNQRQRYPANKLNFKLGQYFTINVGKTIDNKPSPISPLFVGGMLTICYHSLSWVVYDIVLPR
jgi:hypothetical protein